MTAPIGASLASPTAKLVATVVFPTPPFGDITEITRPRTRFWLASSEAACLRLLDVSAACSNASRIRPGSVSGGRTSRIPDRMAASVSSGAATAASTSTMSGKACSRPAAKGEHLLSPDVGAEYHHIDGTAQVLGQQVAGAAARGFGCKDLDVMSVAQRLWRDGARTPVMWSGLGSGSLEDPVVRDGCALACGCLSCLFGQPDIADAGTENDFG